MFYNVAQLLKENIGATRHYSFEGQLSELDDYNPDPVPIHGTVVLLRSAMGVLATVDASFEANQECRRCLSQTHTAFTLHFEEEYQPTIDIETGLKLKLDDDVDPVLLIDEHHILGITELLRQYALVELGEESLCRPDCKGLCPECGQNLNEGPCSCQKVSLDPRLSVLGQLLSPDK